MKNRKTDNWQFMVETLSGMILPVNQDAAEQLVEKILLFGYNISKSDDQVYRA